MAYRWHGKRKLNQSQGRLYRYTRSRAHIFTQLLLPTVELCSLSTSACKFLPNVGVSCFGTYSDKLYTVQSYKKACTYVHTAFVPSCRTVQSESTSPSVYQLFVPRLPHVWQTIIWEVLPQLVLKVRVEAYLVKFWCFVYLCLSISIYLTIGWIFVPLLPRIWHTIIWEVMHNYLNNTNNYGTKTEELLNSS